VITEKQKTDVRYMLISVRGISAKTVANGIRTHAHTDHRKNAVPFVTAIASVILFLALFSLDIVADEKEKIM